MGRLLGIVRDLLVMGGLRLNCCDSFFFIFFLVSCFYLNSNLWLLFILMVKRICDSTVPYEILLRICVQVVLILFYDISLIIQVCTLVFYYLILI